MGAKGRPLLAQTEIQLVLFDWSILFALLKLHKLRESVKALQTRICSTIATHKVSFQVASANDNPAYLLEAFGSTNHIIA